MHCAVQNTMEIPHTAPNYIFSIADKPVLRGNRLKQDLIGLKCVGVFLFFNCDKTIL